MSRIRRGILLTGGLGSRLGAFTQRVSNKHLFPIGDKLVLDYSINTIRLLGITELTVILGGDFYSDIVDVLHDGSQLGLNINYVYQRQASGIAQAINLTKPFLKEDRFICVLGDNCFQRPIQYRPHLLGAQIILNRSDQINLQDFGVISLDGIGQITSIEEKPQTLNPSQQQYAMTGCYVLDQSYFDYFKQIKPSGRNEFEITDILKQYWKDGKLAYWIQDGWWSDLGRVESIDKVRELMKTKPVEWYHDN